MENTCRGVWKREYCHLALQKDYTEKVDDYEIWRARSKETLDSDEFARYRTPGAVKATSTATAATKTFNPLHLWEILGQDLPSIRQWAFDTFACPATSCECERVFSSAKRLITPDRNSLGDELIEALECLKAWWANGLVKRE
jgi:hypothetical protein